MAERWIPIKEEYVNAKTKRRLIAVTGVIVIVLIVILALVGGSSAAKTVSVADAASGSYVDQKVQVSGNVVENSFKTEDNVLVFSIYDPEGGMGNQLTVSYEGGVAATFGNDVTAICTGKIGSDGVLRASELVTKCPSKYENASDALTVEQLIGYGTSVQDKPVKLAGTVKDSTLSAAGQGDRFVIVDEGGSAELPVSYEGALSDEIKGGSAIVLTGSLSADGRFTATDVALKG